MSNEIDKAAVVAQPTECPVREEVKPSIQTLVVPNSKAEGTRLVAKDTASGRFVSNKKLTRNQRAKQDIQKYLAKEVRPGVTKDLELIEHMAKVALECGADNAVGLAKLYEEIQLRGRGKAEETDETKNFHTLYPVKFVIIQAPNLMHSEPIELAPKTPLKPNFVDAQFTTNGEE